ncbi:MAG: 1-deoxy-D-xylulose-5-phosphate reductoisomerase, partial [Bacteroidaceae bacterium]|nr:1-deoxy-D-xylulose-5-phosphate reductoisomerase [Bacteroidaceae bacterium]
KRLKSSFDRIDFFQMKDLTFERPDTERFRCLALAFESLHKGGNMPCIVNAANEIVNRAFIEDRISFARISEIIEKSMNHVAFSTCSDLETYLETDKEARAYAASLL